MTNDIVAASRRTCELLGIDRVRQGLSAFTERREGPIHLTCFIGEACGRQSKTVNEFLWAGDERGIAVRHVYTRFELSSLRSIIHQAVLAWLADQEAIEAATQPVPDVRTVGL